MQTGERVCRICVLKKVKSECMKSKDMRCSRYGNCDRMHVILSGEQLEEVDWFKYLGSQVAAYGACERDSDAKKKCFFCSVFFFAKKKYFFFFFFLN